MPKPYSEDLRQRVIKCLEEKMLLKNIATNLDLSMPTVKRYSSQYKKLGHLNVKKEAKTGRSARFNDLNEVVDFVKENNNLSLADMAQKLNCGKSTLHRAIKKANLTLKKSRFSIKKETKKNAQNLLKP